MKGDYRAQPGDLLCQFTGCTNAAQDGWWLPNGDFHYACWVHVDAQRTADMPDGVLEQPPGYDVSAMNPANVPKPHKSSAYLQSTRPIRPAMKRWVYQLLKELGGNDTDLATIMGAGYRDVSSLSHHAGSWLVLVLQTAVLDLAPPNSDE